VDFHFFFSSGDPKKLEQARGTLTNAIIGLVIIVAAVSYSPSYRRVQVGIPISQNSTYLRQFTP